MIGKLKDFMRLAGGEWLVSFTTRSDHGEIFEKLRNGMVEIEINKPKDKRSKTANDFCWAMCTDIGNAISPPLPKEMVYRQAIREVGSYQRIPIRPEDVEGFCKRWATKGIGWFAEVADDVWIQGKMYKLVFAYWGTSTYDSTEMSRLLDYLKQDMENMGLPIPLSKKEELRLLSKLPKAS